MQPARIPLSNTPTIPGPETWKEVQFTAADGVQLSGWFVPPPPESNGATLIFIHGLGSNRSALVDQTTMLVAQGYGALLFDLRAHGQSQGRQSTWGVNEWLDVAAARAYLRQQPTVNQECIGLVGHSMGAAIAIHAAVQLPEIRLVVAESAYTGLDDNAAALTVSFARLPGSLASIIVPWAEQIAGVQIEAVRPIDEVAHIAPRPILFIHGQQDSTIDADNSRRLYMAAREPKSLLLLPHTGHEKLMTADAAALEDRLSLFLETYSCD